ncbi:MAG: IS66 family transposase [Gaiellales bacterium]
MERHEAEAIYDAGREHCVDFILALEARYERLEARVEKLEEQLRRSSRNSSLPPSQDPPSAPPRPRKPSSGRRPGGQLGHEGRSRPLLPLERIAEIVEHWPERCRACAHRFGEEERIDAAPVQRRQVSELPPIAVTVTEHRLHRLRCPACAAETRAELPAELPAGVFGPRLQAAVATLAVRNRVSRRDTVELVRDLFGGELSAASADAIVRGAGEALVLPYEQLLRHLREASAVNVDETGWRLRGSKRTLWGALTPTAAIFRIAADRHERELRALLGDDFEGVACSDRWWAYNYLDPERRQLCWAHLVRDFTAHSEGLAAQKEFGEAGLALAGRLFQAWDDYRQGGDRARLLEQVTPLKRELRTLLERSARKSTKTKYHRLFAKNLLKHWPALWTFTLLDGVGPTNNHAERGLRGAVIYRKLSLGSQSAHGERTIERLLSASVTCRLQGRSLFAYLSDVLTANIRGDPIPTLT